MPSTAISSDSTLELINVDNAVGGDTTSIGKHEWLSDLMVSYLKPRWNVRKNKVLRWMSKPVFKERVDVYARYKQKETKSITLIVETKTQANNREVYRAAGQCLFYRELYALYWIDRTSFKFGVKEEILYSIAIPFNGEKEADAISHEARVFLRRYGIGCFIINLNGKISLLDDFPTLLWLLTKGEKEDRQ